jgi:hypothetical protein
MREVAQELGNENEEWIFRWGDSSMMYFWFSTEEQKTVFENYVKTIFKF